MTPPILSVIMPVYNAAPYLSEAIESILNQTFKNFEFIILNDGSTDNSSLIASSYDDKRIIYVDGNENLGLVARLNEGIKLARGKYVARMDSDDIAVCTRFEKQMNYLIKNSHIGLLGTAIRCFNTKIKCREFPVNKKKEHPLQIQWESFFNNPFAHVTVVYKKDIVEKAGGYIDHTFPAEDYHLWIRMVELTTCANLMEPLVKVRIRGESISSSQNKIQMEKHFLYSSKKMSFFLNKDVPTKFVRFLSDFKKQQTFSIDGNEADQFYYLVYEFYKKFKRKYPFKRKLGSKEIKRDVSAILMFLALNADIKSLYKIVKAIFIDPRILVRIIYSKTNYA